MECPSNSIKVVAMPPSRCSGRSRGFLCKLQAIIDHLFGGKYLISLCQDVDKFR